MHKKKIFGGIRQNYERSAKQSKSIWWNDEFVSRDFRHTLPVNPRSTPVDELNACLTFDQFC